MMMSAKQMKARLSKLSAIGMMSATATPRFYCDICKKAFPSASALIAHGQKAHGR